LAAAAATNFATPLPPVNRTTPNKKLSEGAIGITIVELTVIPL